MSEIMCNVPFCENTIAKKTYVYCWPHRAENDKYNRNRMEFVMPLWAVKNCKIHGPLRESETIAKRTNPSGNNSPVCKKCRAIKHPYCPIAAKVANDRNKERRRNQKLQRDYGISIDEYNQILESQNNLCALCGMPQCDFDKKTNKVRALAVDHNHITGKARALLCTSCNTGIGLFREDVSLLEKAIRYLNHHNTI